METEINKNILRPEQEVLLLAFHCALAETAKAARAVCGREPAELPPLMR